MKHKNTCSGFTLIELLVVVLIIGILTAVALPHYTTAVEKSRATEALSLMNAVANAAERHRLQKDTWPAQNAFSKLDVEVPERTDGQFGGKNFIITMGDPTDANGGAGVQFVVVAQRDLNNADSQYSLKTVLTENGNGTVTISRFCTSDNTISLTNTVPSTNTKAYTFCNAITSGSPSDF